MNELEPGAKALIDAARLDEPPAADRDRLKQQIFLQVATIGAVASAGAGAAVAGSMSLGAKVGVAVLAISLAGGGAVGVMKLREKHQADPAAQHLVAQRAPAAHKPQPVTVENLPAEMPEAVALPQPESKARKADRPRRQPEQVSTAAVPQDQINFEVAVLKRAREALQLGQPAQALRALAEYDRLFGKGVLGEERQAMAAIALCQVQPGTKAREQAEAFVRSSPNSPLCERVRAACITPPSKK